MRGFAAALLIFLPVAATAQGVSTAGLQGQVHSGPRKLDARIRVIHEPSGVVIDASAARGRFFMEGLEPGGPYTITARAIGLRPTHLRGIFLKLGELREVDLDLQPLQTVLDTVTVVAPSTPESEVGGNGGTGMIIPSSIIDRLPTINRDFYDFVRLVPQISTKVTLSNPGMSGGGVGFRFNNYLINGVTDRTLSGNVSSSFGGTRSIPLDAVEEYQVLLAPYDVRHGEFSGALINTVTRSGTNDMRGRAFVYGRTDAFARYQSGAGGNEYQRMQYGFTAGGPIVRNRLHFFAASELVQYDFPATGPYVGQPANSTRPVPVSVSDIDRFQSIMRNYGLTAGSGERVENESPTRNLFGRVDLALPAMNSRLVLWHSYGANNDRSFSRAARDTFPLTSSQFTRSARFRTTALRFNTTLRRRGGGNNELVLSNRSDGLDPIPRVTQPAIRVAVPSISGPRITLNSGTQEIAQGAWVRASTRNVRNTLTVPLHADHVVSVGAEAEFFRLRRGQSNGSFGGWSFSNLDDFAAGQPDVYQVRIDIGNSGKRVSGHEVSAFISDNWTATSRLSITAGARADVIAIKEHAPYESLVDSIFNRRTDEMPPQRIEISPRLGFSLNVSESQTIRGGAGVFTSRYPLAWMQTALSNYGGGGVLQCTRLGRGMGPPPAFNPDYQSPPMACANGSTVTEAFSGEVDLLNRSLRMMSVFRGSVGIDQDLWRGLKLTVEGLFTRARAEPVFENLNLGEPVGTAPDGRVMYGAVQPNGTVNAQRRSPFIEVIDLRDHAHTRSYQFSTRVERRSSAGFGGSASYTFTHVRDAQTPVRVNTPGRVTWASSRVLSGRDNELNVGVSSNDLPHRIVVQGIYALPKTRTEISFYYLGESGRPFTYVAFGTGGRGDLNADGSNSNDPIYVPRSVTDTTEIRLSGLSDSTGADSSAQAQAIRIASQRSSLEALIHETSCLRRQRGKILERNSCREPWSNTTIASIRHLVPISNTSLEIQLDAFNPLRLIRASWGARREAAPLLLEQVGQTNGTVNTSRPIFRFNSNDPRWTTLPIESAFQMQLGARYRF